MRLENNHMDEKILKDITSRLDKLERVVFGGNSVNPAPSGKTITLPEIIRGKEFRSGQEKVAIIVGYYEKIAHRNPVKESDLKKGWKVGKFDGKYSPGFLARAASWVRNIDSNLDLSQTGEEFFNNFLESKSGSN